jgi:hypothetical protein
MVGDVMNKKKQDGVGAAVAITPGGACGWSNRRDRRLREVYATIVTLGVMYFFVCAAYGTFETLQSTINVEGGLGTTATGALYACAIVSSLLAAPTIVARLGPRMTLSVGWVVQLFYAVANAFPRWETLVPAAAGVGATFAATSIVYGLYVTALAEQATDAKQQRQPAPGDSNEDENPAAVAMKLSQGESRKGSFSHY